MSAYRRVHRVMDTISSNDSIRISVHVVQIGSTWYRYSLKKYPLIVHSPEGKRLSSASERELKIYTVSWRCAGIPARPLALYLAVTFCGESRIVRSGNVEAIEVFQDPAPVFDSSRRERRPTVDLHVFCNFTVCSFEVGEFPSGRMPTPNRIIRTGSDASVAVEVPFQTRFTDLRGVVP
jgi:hypothetical protein